MPLLSRITVLPCLLAASGAALAQTHHVAPPEKVTRAVAVYEWTGDLSKPTASRLVPVSLFINGRLEDAGLYLARPVPFAIEPGDIYSVEEAGDHKGDLLIEHARDFTTGRLLADQEPIGAWYGYGRFSPLPPAKPSNLKPSAHPAAIVSSSDSDTGRPHFGNKPADNSTGTKDAGTKDTGAKDTGAAGGTTTTASDDPDRPTLGRRTGASSGSDDSTGSTGTGTKSSDNDPERPSLRKRSEENTGKRTPPQSGVTGPERSLNDDPDRPVIRHGKTVEQEDAAELKTNPPDMHQAAAVSDPVFRDPHVFTRAWETPSERGEILGQMQALARSDAAAYLAQNHLTAGPLPAPHAATPSAAPAGTPTDAAAPTLRRTPSGVNTTTTSNPASAASQSATASSATAKPGTRSRSAASARGAKSSKPAPPAPILLTAEQLYGYTLSYGGLPTFVYTAQVPVTGGGTVYVTVLAQRLPSGELQTALRSTTDSLHLDRTPWMRPVDAVDPDASHRASLLFELRAQKTRQFALYRLISAQAEQEFVSEPIP